MVCLIIVSTSGPDLSRFRLSLVRLVTRSAKARFGQVGNQVRKVKDQVGQGQGHELDNKQYADFIMFMQELHFFLNSSIDCAELENHKKETGHEDVTRFSFADC